MKAAWTLLCFLISILSYEYVNAQVTTGAFLTPADRLRLKQVFVNSISTGDIGAVHYSVLGLSLIGEKVPSPQDTCKLLSAGVSKATSPEVLYHIADTWKSLSCSGSLPPSVAKDLNTALEADGSTMATLYYSYQGLGSLGQKPKDPAAFIKKLQTVIKKDDSLLKFQRSKQLSNLGYLFHIAASLGQAGSFAVERIEDAIVQADEVDRRMLQYEGGLSITALIVSGAYKLATAVDSKQPMTGEQAVKFANYFLSRRSVQLPKGSYSLLEVLQTLTNNKYHQAVSVTLASSSAVSVKSPTVSVRVSDLLGRPLGSLTVTADTVKRLSDDVVEIANAPFTPTSGDNTLYTLDLSKATAKRGFYKISISAKSTKADSKFVGNTGASLLVKVLGSVAVDLAEIGTADADQTTAPKLNKVNFPGKAGFMVEADWHQRLLMRFTLKDQATKESMTVHQAFVKLTNQVTGQETIFVAEPDSSKVYRFDMDIGARANDFNHYTGRYSLSLLIGDAVLSNSFSWEVAEVSLKFSSSKTPSDSKVGDMYKPKTEIKHLFREPEKRPPATVSSLFTILVCLPLLVLLILWAKIGVNISNFPFSLSALGFHLGLGGIFGLFCIFWLQLNMFQTLKYLIAVGMITFLCGNKLLAKLAANRQK